MKKQAILKNVMRALRWGGKRKGVVTRLSRLKADSDKLADHAKRLNALIQSGRIPPEQAQQMLGTLTRQQKNVDNVTKLLIKYKKLGDQNRAITGAVGAGGLAAGAVGTAGLGAAGMAAKDLYDQEAQQAKYVSPMEQMRLNEEGTALTDALAKRKQHGSWW